jgi:hypothetical protein
MLTFSISIYFILNISKVPQSTINEIAVAAMAKYVEFQNNTGEFVNSLEELKSVMFKINVELNEKSSNLSLSKEEYVSVSVANENVYQIEVQTANELLTEVEQKVTEAITGFVPININ